MAAQDAMIRLVALETANNDLRALIAAQDVTMETSRREAVTSAAQLERAMAAAAAAASTAAERPQRTAPAWANSTENSRASHSILRPSINHVCLTNMIFVDLGKLDFFRFRIFGTSGVRFPNNFENGLYFFSRNIR